MQIIVGKISIKVHQMTTKDQNWVILHQFGSFSGQFSKLGKSKRAQKGKNGLRKAQNKTPQKRLENEPN